MDEITPRDLRPRVYSHGQFEGQRLTEEMRRQMARQANTMNMAWIFVAVVLGLIAICAAGSYGFSKAEAAYQIERRV